MARTRFVPKLNKKRIFTHEDCTVYSVKALAVRNVSLVDEEFGNFATEDQFPNLVPQGEIWIAEKKVVREGLFFIANALARLKALAEGSPQERAYQAGLDVERLLRERLNGVSYRDGQPHKRVPESVYLEHYRTLPDEKYPIEVWVVDGNLVRSDGNRTGPDDVELAQFLRAVEGLRKKIRWHEQQAAGHQAAVTEMKETLAQHGIRLKALLQAPGRDRPGATGLPRHGQTNGAKRSRSPGDPP